MPKKKSPITVILIILGFLILGFGLFWVYKSFVQETIVPDDCKKYSHEKLHQTDYTCELTGANVPSEYECYVSGHIDKDVGDGCDMTSPTQKVIARRGTPHTRDYTNYDVVAIDENRDGTLTPYIFGTTYRVSEKTFDYEFSDGYGIWVYSSKKIYYGKNVYDNRVGRYYFEGGTYTSGGNIDTSSTPKEGCVGNEACELRPEYTCSFGFCPNVDYCSKTRTEKYAWSEGTPKQRLTKTQSINFDPLDGNGNPLPSENFYLDITVCDLSCSGVYTDKCDPQSEAVYCEPQSKTYIQCSNILNNAKNSAKNSCVNDGCKKCLDKGGGYRAHSCGYPNLYGYKYECGFTDRHKICDDFNADGCPIWKTIDFCSGVQFCIPDGGTEGQAGFGYCKCDPTGCSLGTRQSITSPNYDFEECILVAGCTNWEGKTCQQVLGFTGTTYNTIQQKCLWSEDECNSANFPKTEWCESQTIMNCVTDNKRDEADDIYYQGQAGVTCSGAKTCTETDNDNAICKCPNYPQKECITTTTYWQRNEALPQCREQLDVPSGFICYNDAILPEEDVPCNEGGTYCEDPTEFCSAGTCIQGGCAFGTVTCENEKAGSRCDDDPSSNTFNTCVCDIDDGTYCTDEQAIRNIKKCTGSDIYKRCEPQPNTCPTWSGNMPCSYPQVCSEIGGVAECRCPPEFKECTKQQYDDETTKCRGDFIVEKCVKDGICYLWKEEQNCQDLGDLYICIIT